MNQDEEDEFEEIKLRPVNDKVALKATLFY